MKKFNAIMKLAAMLLIAAMLFALAACGGNGRTEANATEAPEAETPEPTEAPTEEPTPETTEAPTEEPTPEPTEAGFIPEPVEDYSKFDKPLTDVCALALEPNYQNFKAVLPQDFFDNLALILEATLIAQGVTLEDTEFESMDELLEYSLAAAMPVSFFDDYDDVENVERIDYEILSAETADPEFVKGELNTYFGEFLDLEKVTEAYRLSADLTVSGGDQSHTENSEMYVYCYDGEYYILFSDGVLGM